MSFDQIKQAASGKNTLVVDNLTQAENVNLAARDFEAENYDVFVWGSKRIRFNNRENQDVLRLVERYGTSWKVIGDCLVVARTPEALDAVINPPKPDSSPVTEPVSDPVIPQDDEIDDPVIPPDAEDEDDNDTMGLERFKNWE